MPSPGDPSATDVKKTTCTPCARFALPLALLASANSIVGALAGLARPVRVVQVALGVTIPGIVVLLVFAGVRALLKGTEVRN